MLHFSMPRTFKACSIMIDSGFPIKIGSTPVDTATTDVNERYLVTIRAQSEWQYLHL